MPAIRIRGTKRFLWSLAVTVVSFLLPTEGCGPQTASPFRRESTAMDTFVSVTIFERDIGEQNASGAAEAVFREIERVEAAATNYNDSSEIGRINLHSGVDSVRVSDEIAGLIRESIRYSAESDGAFDITVGPLVRLWNFLADKPLVPSDVELRNLLHLVDRRLVSTNGNMIYLKKKGMSLDLGAIAKGYAVDRAIALLRQSGMKQVIVDLGGNLGVYWEGTWMLDSTRATIYIRHPRRDGEMFGHFDVGTSGVSTSGDYQRYFIQEGKRYHHILDPHTGYPVREVVSVTVIAANAMEADALSTTAFVLGLEKGMDLIETLPDVEGLMVYEEGDTLAYMVSSGLRGKFFVGDGE